MDYLETGRLVASVLTRSWRREPPEPEVTAAQLAEVAPILVRTGAGGLAWWRVRASALRNCPAAQSLRQAFGEQAFRSGFYEAAVAEAVSRVRAIGVEPVVLKGVGVARLYPAKGLRQPGDVDLAVPHENRAAAEAALDGRRFAHFDVDFSHLEYSDLLAGDFDSFLARCDTLDVAGVDIRVPRPEDAFRYLCMHYLRHYGYRPLWLCDIAAALEALPERFDWNECLGTDERVANWVLSAAGLACRLLGAEPSRRAPGFEPSPDWVADAVLRLWGRGQVKVYQPRLVPIAPMHDVVSTASLRRPLEPWRAARTRWRDPYEFTIDTRRPFERTPPTLPRVGDAIRRAARFLASREGA